MPRTRQLGGAVLRVDRLLVLLVREGVSHLGQDQPEPLPRVLARLRDGERRVEPLFFLDLLPLEVPPRVVGCRASLRFLLFFAGVFVCFLAIAQMFHAIIPYLYVILQGSPCLEV